MIIRKIAVTITILCSSFGASFADKLPKDAVKLTPQEVTDLYSGFSSNWSRSNAYFSPDGAYFLVGKNGNFVGEGKWSVSDNQVCADFTVKGVKDGGSKKARDCWAWYKQGDKHWTFWNGEKDKRNGFYTGEKNKLSKGDKVTDKFRKLVASQ
ncbi:MULTISPECIES: DUF995 domain-containing protein [Agrobacterium]|uniref:DUF995 domain-containing protein n=1 Tax=Agrobacterium tumefaciens TaxID=358 RepID=UPI001574CC65|nr:DUF995 domain-containing protein [Agrobacterium tumefaciens]MDR5012211.1 DUF995 domain-containing protein [Agrobacterium tumefaciens]NSY62187.1 DUF995 domain-containing protein [Agrobacterium tumefaciens]NSY72091.1 DUF995 domain-containing protein [Agrobacterium tumefaciens]NSZ71576.1 DUF995 domain-containing protein [Agrobacterium tumefaciens]NTA84020.1 DUF995 domain-containing protein [Agrobacterium tumefaciens]